MKNKERDWTAAITAVGVAACTLLIIAFVGTIIIKQMDSAITSICCCDGQICSDTYYDAKNDVCVLTLCQHDFLLFNKSQCHYKPYSNCYNITLLSMKSNVMP